MGVDLGEELEDKETPPQNVQKRNYERRLARLPLRSD